MLRPQTLPADAAAPCPLTKLSQWHQYHADRHRIQLQTDPGALVTARYAWHRDWAAWHQQQAQAAGN